tara:strand:- start:2701 stop:3396 length:696 start_codon:yes stop_codon:yes gene_type:complete
MDVIEKHFESDNEAAQALADAVAENLREGILRRGRGSLVVSGGRSPIAFFHALRVQKLDWRKVEITLADERWVEPTSEDSNERLLRQHLLKDEAIEAKLVSLKTSDLKPMNAVVEIIERISAMPRPFDAVVLGMGADGHTASLFPNMPALSAMLNPQWAVQVGTATAPTEPKNRVTLTLRALLDTRQLYLSISGAEKVEVYAAASAGNREYPVASLFHQRLAPVSVFIVGA